MKQYYEGNVMSLEYHDGMMDTYVVEPHVKLYQNRLKRWVYLESHDLPNTKEEAYDAFFDAFHKSNGGLLQYYITYLDESSIQEIPMTKQEAKTLRKQYQRQHKKQQNNLLLFL